MWPTSAEFTAALAQSRRLAQRVDVLYGGTLQTTLDVVVDGSVTAEDATVRRTARLRLIDPTGALTPVTARDLLAPRGTELGIYKGLVLPWGVAETVPLGTFRIVQPRVARTETGGVEIDPDGYDRARAIQRARFAAPYVIPAGTPTHQAIETIITSRSVFPTAVIPSASTTPELVFEALSDPWKAAQELATSDGYECFFDVLGTCIIRPQPNPDTLPATFTYAPGDLSLLLEDSRELDDDRTYNGVVITAEHPTQTPIRVTVWDTDTRSPTYYDPANPSASVFGPVPYGYHSPSITSVGQATTAAQAILTRVSGLMETVELSTAGHPGHDVGDVIEAEDPATRLAGRHVIQKITQPVRRGPMRLKMRSRRLAL